MTMNPTSDLHARRLYVGGVPITASEEAIIKYLNETLRKAGGTLEPGDPIIKT